MCGISGIINGDIQPMVDRQRHRGNDGSGIMESGGVWFGHNRLAIIDLSENGKQPMDSDRYMLTYNGEIYNYRDFYSGTGNDARALLYSIASIGIEATLGHLNGMYAFAVYDKIERKIYLVVDRFGQKPLYYYQKNNRFAFASSPVALLHLQDKWSIDWDALQSYWMLGSVMGGSSIWDGIRKVEGGYMLTYDIDAGRMLYNRYWLPEYQSNTNGIEDLVIDAIDKVKIADVPVHIFLSGGIDSTLVASRFSGGDAVHLASVETDYARQSADRFGINLHVVSPEEISVKVALMDYSSKCGEPTMAGIIPYIVARETCKYAKVAVTANGADELFFGYDRTSDIINKYQWNHIFRTGFDYRIEPDEIDERLSAGRWMELQTYVMCDLNKTLDFASMSHTVEVRAPFLDHRLAEMALSIPQKKHGRKDILKNMLRQHGFDDAFLNRPKRGFSLYYTPPDIDRLRDDAFVWCQQNGFLRVPKGAMSGRDSQYLRMSALGFYYWYKEFQSIIA